METRKNSKRYFGLTLVQLLVLVGLGLLLCGSLAGLGWLYVDANLLAANVPTLVAPTQAVAALPPTETPTSAPSPTATLAPTGTPVPRESLIPLGWVKMASGSMELWLPPGYVGGDLMTDREATARRIGALGPEYALAAEVARTAPVNVLIFAVDSNESPYTILTAVRVSFEPEPVTDLDAYVDALIAGLPLDYVVMEKHRFVTVGGFLTHRLAVQSGQGGNMVMQQLYVLLDGDTVWRIEYSAHINVFYTLQPTFEQSFLTFWINK